MRSVYMNESLLTLCLNSSLSSMVSVSALAITGTMLTIFPSRFINSTSIGRNLTGNVGLDISWFILL